jgi:TonB family protein
MRTGQHGVVEVGFDVDAHGRPGPVSVVSSSGSPALDQAAIAAASQSVCNLPKGDHVTFPITFGLNASN